jgi:uncharacterized membrane protein HdeD (DUF308 family)
MQEPVGPNAPVGADYEAQQTYQSTAVERAPWSPAQAVALILGVLFAVLGGICLARTGLAPASFTGDHVSVAGSNQTAIMGYLELAFGALLLIVGAIPGAGRGGMSFAGVVALIFGIIVIAQPSSFSSPLGIGSGYGVFLIVVGAVLLVTAIVAPIYWGGTRRTGGIRTARASSGRFVR